jgi:hypothetical protein
MNADKQGLARAIEYLGAVEVAPGRYAMTWGRRWYVTDAEGVELTRLLGAGEMIASIPCKMPAWWSPENRVMLRCPSCQGVISRWPKDDAWKVDRCEHCDGILIEPDAGYDRITADLETGEEVPA